MLAGLVLLQLALCIWLFLGLAIVCDDYLVPAIEIVCKRWKIPDEAAGASLLAFGSSAPEILISMMATLHGRVEMSLSAILGSAIIAFGLIPAVVAIAHPEGCTTLSWAPLLRDFFFYVASLFMLIYFMVDRLLDAKECGLLSFFFVIYIAAIYIPIAMANSGTAAKVVADEQASKNGTSNGVYGAVMSANKEEGAGDEENALIATADDQGGEKEGKGGEEGDEESEPLVVFFSCPFNTLFSFTIPSCDDDHEGNYAMTFLASLFYVALLSDVCLFLAQSIAKASTAPASVVGATLLALGAQVPDTIGSLAMAKSGMCDGAISNAIGSQVINVTIGTGLPFLLYALYFGKPITVPDPGNVEILSMGLTFIVALYLVLLFTSNGIQCKYPFVRAGLNQYTGAVLLVGYLVVNAVTIFFGA